MSEPAISVEGLSKRYKIGLATKADRNLREAMADWLSAPWRRFRALGEAAGAAETFWALKDVSFQVTRGEVVGIIGRNGAGKSTLLKILSQITLPTGGRAVIRGRVGSLLEVGTGFHPDLSGRENIYLNGALLGMTRADIARQFDAIVDFSGVEGFLDTPVKRYSSGMRVRLGFAVAAHLEPEILIVDEVLAVGDAEFQKKCLGKMDQVARGGRTVLFVSHNMAAVESLCTRGILLEHGRAVYDGPSGEAVGRYLRSMESAIAEDLATRTDRKGDGACRIVDVWLEADDGRRVGSVGPLEPFSVVMQYECDRSVGPDRAIEVAFSVNDQYAGQLYHFDLPTAGATIKGLDRAGRFTCRIDSGVALRPGRYAMNTWVRIGNDLADFVVNAAALTVHEADVVGAGRLPVAGRLCAVYRWRTSEPAKALAARTA
ncbi:MAG: ABC transporter ATP-binding protein [Planctomycetes bacterium]|nr:ABC transporter ATP-binding protein [Planctomycetota bacterium]